MNLLWTCKIIKDEHLFAYSNLIKLETDQNLALTVFFTVVLIFHCQLKRNSAGLQRKEVMASAL